MKTQTKTVDYYVNLPYTVEVHRIPDHEGGGFSACIPLLGRWSAVGDGDTASEAVGDLFEALPSLLEEWIKAGVEIPEPDDKPDESGEYTGKLSLRLPTGVHARAAHQAKAEHVSLNLYLATVIAEAVGAKKPVSRNSPTA